MNNTMFLTAGIFLAAYVLIISEKIHRTIIAMLGASLLIFAGIETQAAAVSHIDWNTLGLLMGMMIIVNITRETGLFKFLAIWAAKQVHARPVPLLFALSAITMVCSGLLDNVTTVLLTVPLTFSMASQLKIDVKPFLISQILASNIGGTATLIGDPPNIMIGSAAGLSFSDFICNLTGLCIFLFIITDCILVFLFRKGLKTSPALQEQVLLMDEKDEIQNRRLLYQCLFVLVLTISLFALHDVLGIETATAAMAGAALLLLLACHDNEPMITRMLSNIEWLAIFFFAGLFVLVGSLVDTGIISILAEKAMELTSGSETATSLLILWLSAVCSAFIDNIPFVATLIPLIKDMGTMGMTNLDPLWWSLSLGACLGGNGTLIGASANVVVASMAARKGVFITFLEFMKIAFPLMILSILISSVYVYLRYL
ncbi:SLC13 family permease [Dialister sp.]|uniref:SLC13 family permease n=1 Tax=Dialister sp. TaxID=1955814 RepID=UPI003F029CD1